MGVVRGRLVAPSGRVVFGGLIYEWSQRELDRLVKRLPCLLRCRDGERIEYRMVVEVRADKWGYLNAYFGDGNGKASGAFVPLTWVFP